MQIVIIGGGSFGTAMAHQLSENPHNDITILLRDKKVEESINSSHINSKYYPRRPLLNNIKASVDYSVLKTAEVVLICTPTKSLGNVTAEMKANTNADALIINMSKGLMPGGETIVTYLKEQLQHSEIITMKGGSFSTEMMNSLPTLFTIGFSRKNQLETVFEMTKDTNIFLDYTNDIQGVEVLSALKNIYAIALGNVDARYNALNTRYMILTKVVEEIKIILGNLGGQESTIFKSCGIGDITLTGLSDLSRNRTLGLLIGKGFFNKALSDNTVVLEGLNTLGVVDKTLSETLKERLSLFSKIKSLLKEPEIGYFDFQTLFRKGYKTVLTYGTFDLLHYGHLELLRRIKEMGDHVIVGLSTEEFNKIKGKTCVMNYEKRKHLLEVLSYVDLVIPEENWDQKIDDIKNYDVDMLVMGSDWEGKFDDLEPYCEVVYLPRTEGISTTQLKSLLKK